MENLPKQRGEWQDKKKRLDEILGRYFPYLDLPGLIVRPDEDIVTQEVLIEIERARQEERVVWEAIVRAYKEEPRK
jgi:hypothetical protein